MKKPEIPENEAERLAFLEQYNILDSLPEQAFDDITAIAAQVCGTPIALVSLIDKNRQWFKSTHGLNVSETSREVSYCAHAIHDPNQIMEVEDASLDERFKNNPLLKGAPYIRYYAGSPLVNTAGHALGTLCVIDHQPRRLSDEQKKVLAALSRHVVLLLESRVLAKDLKLTQFSFENSPAGIAWINETAKIVKFNDRYAELVGYSKEQLANKRIFDFDPNFSEERWKAQWREMCERKTMTIETQFVGMDSSVRSVELNLKLLEFENKEYIHAVCIDITESTEAKKREQEILKGLQDLIKEKDDLIGLFSHDMKSPINQVKGLGQIMSMSLNDKEVLKESLVKLDQTANRQLNLYKNILAMLRSDQFNEIRKISQPVLLLPFVNKLVKGLEWESSAKNIIIKISIPENLVVEIQVNLFSQALQNLLSNSIKFSNEGEEVEIIAHEKGGKIFITIKDDGIGFDQDKADALFQRFTKEGRRGTNNEASTGLGLYLVKMIIESHEGSIEAKSKGAGKGASFTICLPKR